MIYQQLLAKLFTYDYSGFKIQHFDKETFQRTKILPTENIFILPMGFCRRPVNFSLDKAIKMVTRTRLTILLEDPYQFNRVRSKATPKASIQLKDLSGESQYKVTYTIHDNKLNNGLSCTDYEQIGTSYGSCIEKALEKEFIEWFGCLPPWFPSSTPEDKTQKCR